MDLLGALQVARRARSLARDFRSLASPPGWLTSEEAFEIHFGSSYQAYEEVVSMLSQEQREMLEDTLAVNPEAAIMWVLAMEVQPC